MNDQALITLENVSYGYGNSTILENVNLAINPSDYIVVIGPNGGGKTTLIRLIMGLLKPQTGEISYNLKTSVHQIGYVPQFSLFEWQFPLTVRDVIRMGRMSRRGLMARFTKSDDQAVNRVAAKLQIEFLLGSMIGELSGGELQRVLISRALISNPELLILDEPTASIDADSRNILNNILIELNKEIPIIMITHDAAVITPQITRIACVNRKFFLHESGEVPRHTLEEVYGCPIELIAHGVPHRVLEDHSH